MIWVPRFACPFGSVDFFISSVLSVGSPIDENVFDVVTGLPCMNYLTGLAVYRCQATDDVGGAVVCGGYDGDFHRIFINCKGTNLTLANELSSTILFF
jgi:hypothetical protein